MKIAFISDIHGNAVALDAVLADIRKKEVEKIVVLGDIAFRGPEPKRSIELIKALETTVVKGNADEWIVRGVKKGEVPDKALELMNKERDWTLRQLDQEAVDYLSELPTETAFETEGVTFHAFHATPTNLFDVVLPHTDDQDIEEKLLQARNADVYLYGHIHKSYIRYINGKTVLNLGSVGLPFDGCTKASYAIVHVNNGSISTSIERVGYDYHKTMSLYDEVKYPNAEMMKKIITNAKI